MRGQVLVFKIWSAHQFGESIAEKIRIFPIAGVFRPIMTAPDPYKSTIICQLRKVTPTQRRMDSCSTPLLSNASISSTMFFPIPISVRKCAPGFRMVRNPSQISTRAEGPATRNGEKGAGYVKPILWTLILVSIVYVAVKVVPVLMAEYEFQDSMQTIARFASANGQTAEKIHDAVLKEAGKRTSCRSATKISKSLIGAEMSALM